MLKLPDVTLICLTNKDFEGHKHALDMSCMDIEFGAVKLIWDEKCNSIEEWNRKIIYELPNYVSTSHCLLIHADSEILNVGSWKNEWLDLDYIGSPWPLPTDDYSYRSESGKIQRVGNSVSLRSKRLMERVAQFPWKSYYGNTNEDGFISVHHREQLEAEGFKFASLEQAIQFGVEHVLPEHLGQLPFLMHKLG